MKRDKFSGFRRNLLESLQALALPADEQVRVLQPGCITCELYNDFVSDLDLYRECCAHVLTEQQWVALDQVVESLEAIPDEAFECFNNACLQHDGWGEARIVAQRALHELDWPLDAPPAYRETQPGIWRRHTE